MQAMDGSSQAHRAERHRFYWAGVLLAAALTVLPFWLVMTGQADRSTTALLIFAMALVQIVVHVAFFLHVDTRSEGGWTLLAFLFTAVIVVLTIGGSVWIMYHLNTNMMPGAITGH
ncbi:cytochrome o ubiquinol oxidase subunit IV [Novosphingobium sp. SG707]|uniref:cytochrome o ubiquinol oxidase subunit IV n=1 Tax=Novosphingobium sp. SG707 TaxID=2586996 RepID=UPI001446836F|nr:cytochrome o ubiquinol oxidase subunit IV [Novosphingobium sp. SG707]